MEEVSQQLMIIDDHHSLLDPDYHLLISRYSSYFNWTMTYRLKSDIPIIYGWLSLKVTKLSIKVILKNI